MYQVQFFALKGQQWMQGALRAVSGITLAILAGCGASTTEPPVSNCDQDRDRQAIMAMQGTFAVSFFFQEVEALDPNYTIDPDPYETGGLEVVEVIEQSDTKIVLQHVLLIPEEGGTYYPLKHWRQDWEFQDKNVIEYQGERIWAHRELTPMEYKCAWTQAVSQVDDGPRYEAYGTWEHDNNGQSSWESSQTYRPLPRREFSRADEYDVLLAQNIHSIDTQGWDHIEDNLKWRLDDNSALARETGLNRYQRIDNPTATQAALDYLDTTDSFWDDVRQEWAKALGNSGRVKVLAEYDGFASYDWLFATEEAYADAPPAERLEAIKIVIAYFVVPLDD